MTESFLLWGLALLGMGLLLIALEVVIPSGGILSLIAGVVAIAGVVLLFQESTTWGFVGIGILAVAVPSAWWFFVRVLPTTPMGRRLILQDRLGGEDDRSPDEPPPTLVGKEGEAVSDLRPTGIAKIEGRRLSVVSESSLIIPAGTRIRVVKEDGPSIIVRTVEG